MLKCAITGANGVLGRRLRENLPYKFYPFKNRIENYNKISKWINSQKFDLVLHLAALVPTNTVKKNLKRAKSVNINGTKNIIKAVLNLKQPPKWFFYASTSHVYQIKHINKKLSEKNNIKPSSKYGQTKREAEKIIEKNFNNKNINFCIGRIFSFTDKRQKIPFVIPSLISKIKKSKKKQINLNNINHYRDFISTKDISLAIKLLFNNKRKGIYNIGSGNLINIKIIAKILAKKYRKKINFLNINKPTYLISDSRKLKKLGWKSRRFKNKLSYFY